MFFGSGIIIICGFVTTFTNIIFIIYFMFQNNNTGFTEYPHVDAQKF